MSDDGRAVPRPRVPRRAASSGAGGAAAGAASRKYTGRCSTSRLGILLFGEQSEESFARHSCLTLAVQRPSETARKAGQPPDVRGEQREIADGEGAGSHLRRDQQQHQPGAELDARSGERVEEVGEQPGAHLERAPNGVALAEVADGRFFRARGLERQDAVEQPADLFGDVSRRASRRGVRGLDAVGQHAGGDDDHDHREDDDDRDPWVDAEHDRERDRGEGGVTGEVDPDVGEEHAGLRRRRGTD